MRLWHYKLIPYLPKSQLIGQWRELNSIFKKQDNHILINYIYEYPRVNLFNYTILVINEMKNRGYKVKTMSNFDNYFKNIENDDDLDKGSCFGENPFPKHHNYRYFLQCFYNLQEKYDRKQKNFSEEEYYNLVWEVYRDYD